MQNRISQHGDFSSFMNSNQQNHQFSQSPFGTNSFGNAGSIDPSALSMNSMGHGQSFMNGFQSNNNNSMPFYNDNSTGLLPDDDLLATFDGQFQHKRV